MRGWVLGSVVASIVVVTACNGSAGANDVCSGGACVCNESSSCNFDTCPPGQSGCRFVCDTGATCSGTCGPSCRVTCDGKSCEHTVGAGSSVTCSTGDCKITCEGPCTVAADVQIQLTCAAGTTQTAAGCS